MKKIILTLTLTGAFVFAKAQTSDLPKIVKDTLFTTSGYKIIEGEKIKIGSGSTPDGDFKYIRINSGSLMKWSSSSGYNGLANSANALPRDQSGHLFKVVSVENRGGKKHGYVCYAKINIGITRYEIDVENAIRSGELAIPDEFKPKDKQSAVAPALSMAEEIKKLKDLLDSGAITQEEYDAGKKKLLNN